MRSSGIVADIALLRAALDTLAEAVTIHDASGRLVYVNDAGARALGASSAEEALAMTPGAWTERWDVFHEDGSRVQPGELPGRRAFAGKAPPPLIVRSVERATGATRWMRIMATPLLDADGIVTAAVNVLSDVTAVKDAERAQRILAEAGEVLSATMDLDRTLEAVARLAVPHLADWCALDLIDEHGRIVPAALVHSDPDRLALGRRFRERYPPDPDAPTGIGAVVRTGLPQRYDDITEEQLADAARDAEHLAMLRELGLRSVLVVPLGNGDMPIGALTLVVSGNGRAFADADVALAGELARRATVAIEHARLYAERASIAHTLQAGLLPPSLTAPPGYDVGMLFRPAGAANEVGGDFYDLVRLDGHWLGFVGDVAGKGAPAARITARARYTLAAIAQSGGDADQALRRLNASLLELDDRPLCTACCVTIGAPDGHATVTCAGHPAPILVGERGAEAVETRGPLLGVSASSTWDAATIEIRRGEALVLYTDGVTDAVGPDGRFGTERLLAAVSDGRAAETGDELARRIGAAVDDFRAGPDRDDIAVLVLRRA